MPSPFKGNYGNQPDSVSKPVPKKQRRGRGHGDDEESELIHNSSDDDIDGDSDLVSVSSSPLMKPMITDRSVSRLQSECLSASSSQLKESIFLCSCYPRHSFFLSFEKDLDTVSFCSE